MSQMIKVVKVKTRGNIITVNPKTIVTLKAVPVDKDKYVGVIETADLKVIRVDLANAPYSDESICLQELLDYIEQGGEA